jgi:hypothetical protein
MCLEGHVIGERGSNKRFAPRIPEPAGPAWRDITGELAIADAGLRLGGGWELSGCQYETWLLVGAEVMTAELEVVLDPAVGGEKTLGMTR